MDVRVLTLSPEVDRLRRLFRFFGATQCRGRSAVYEALSEGIADDDGLLDLLMSTPAEQRRPSLLFAAVNLLLASDVECRPARTHESARGGVIVS
jgi:hypothetical protein